MVFMGLASQKEIFDSATFSPRNRASKFALQPRPKGHDDVMSGTGKSYRKLCDLNFCFGKGNIYLFTMLAVT